MKDFVPTDWVGLKAWLENFSARLTARGAALGFASAYVTALVADITTLVAAIADLLAKQQALTETTYNTKTLRDTTLGKLRMCAKQIKVSPTVTAGDPASFQILGEATTLDEANYKPDFTAQQIGSQVVLDFALRGVTGLKFWARKRGELGWTFLATDTNAPYNDARPLTVPGTPEEREYKARAFIGGPENEIGLESDIMRCLFGGS